MKTFFICMIILINFGLVVTAPVPAETEIREYQGKKLDPYNRDYDNSIGGPQTVDIKKYRLDVTGRVHKTLSLSYDQVMKLPAAKRVVKLYCVEGWSETLLFEGVRLADILKPAGPLDGVKTVIFYAADGYSSSVSYQDAVKLDIMLAAKVNGKVLDAKRGFPLQVVAESKLGYKWVRWVSAIELSDKTYKGYWEQKGYDNEANVD